MGKLYVNLKLIKFKKLSTFKGARYMSFLAFTFDNSGCMRRIRPTGSVFC